MTLKTAIQRVFEALARLGRNRLARNAPVPADRVALELSTLGMEAPDELIALYTVSNGTTHAAETTIGDICVMPGYYWPSLEDATQTYKAVSPSEQWNSAWFPILASGGGDFYAVVCDPTSTDYGAVVGFMLGEPDQIVEFQSVSTLFSTIAASYEAGVFFIADGFLEGDFPQMRALARTIQPDFNEHDA